jgi:orotate phosphoribosyltransferase
VAEAAAAEVRRVMAVDRVDKLASIELKGALILPSIGCLLSLPCVVVRKEDKAYGVTGRTAGAPIANGDHVLFFDDVVSEGLSKVEGIRPLEALGAHIRHVMVVVDREQDGRQNLEKVGYKVHALAKVSDLVKSLHKTGHITKEQADAVLNYVKKT